MALTFQTAGIANPDEAFVARSVSAKLTRLYPQRFGFTTLLERLGLFSKDLIGNVKHTWPEIDQYPRSLTVNGAVTAGSAGASKAIIVDDVYGVRPGDILKQPTNATNAALMLLVTAVNFGTKTLTVYALPALSESATVFTAAAFGTVPAIADDSVLRWVSNAKTEGDTVSAARSIEATPRFNLVQTFDMQSRITDHRINQKSLTGDDWQRIRMQNRLEFRKNQEVAALFNERPSVTADPTSGEKRYTMAGLRGLVTNVIDYPAAATLSAIVDFGYEAFTANASPAELLLIGGKDLMKAIDLADVTTRETRMQDEIMGVKVTKMVTRMGTVNVLYNPNFDEQGYADEGFLVDLENVGRGDYSRMERRRLNLTELGIDAEAEQLIASWTLEAAGNNHARVKVTA